MGYVVAPIHYVANAPYRLGETVKDFVSTRERMNRLIEELTLENQRLELEAARSNAIVEENDRLRELVGSRARLRDDVLVAELIEISTDSPRNEIVIDKGGNSGVAVGQAVLDATGVVGEVVETTWITSRVLLITDPVYATPVQVVRSNVLAIAIGGKGDYLLQDVPVTADIVEGDQLVSSGLGRRFPLRLSGRHRPLGQARGQSGAVRRGRVGAERVLRSLAPPARRARRARGRGAGGAGVNPLNGGWLIVATVVGAAILAVARFPFESLGGDWLVLRPDWAVAVFLFWGITTPRRIGAITAWIVGLFFDVLLASPLGLNAICLAFATYFANRFCQRLILFPIVQQFGLVLGIAFAAQLVERTVLVFVMDVDWSFLAVIVPALTTALIYPPLAMGLTFCALRYRVKGVLRADGRIT